MDAVAFRVLAHEIRGPSAVIAGYVRLFREGRLSGSDLNDALQKIDQAVGRLSQFGRQASELGRWLGDAPAPGPPVALDALADRAVALSGVANERVSRSLEDGVKEIHLVCHDFEALAGAVASCMAATAREAGGGAIRVVARPVPQTAGTPCDVMIGPDEAEAWLTDLSGPEAGENAELERGGMGLALVLAATIIAAHGGALWSAGGRRGLLCLRLPVARG